MGFERMPAARRREMLIDAGLRIAREEGGRAVTLSRVAEACGVSKPIAYRLFDSLADLLVQMERTVVMTYQTVVVEAVTRAHEAGAAPHAMLEVLARTYVSHSLGEGAVYDVVSAARAAAEGVHDHFFELPEELLSVVHDLLAPPAVDERALLLMFQGAADSMVSAVQAGMFEPESAVRHLVSLFAPSLLDAHSEAGRR